MLEMTSRDYIPAVGRYIEKLSLSVSSLLAVLPEADVTAQKKHLAELNSLLSKTYETYGALLSLEERAVGIECTEEAAFFYKNEVNPAMGALRAAVDALEVITAREFWPVPTYGDMTFGV
jgi:glutamine synthetase